MNSLLPSKQNSSSSKGLVLRNRKTNGFTLIELMVVISIIAFLAIIGIAAYANAQKLARDGRRRADVDAIAAALESNRNSTSTSPYAPNGGAAASGSLSIYDGTADTTVAANGADFDKLFASGVRPKDPSDSAGTNTSTGFSINTPSTFTYFTVTSTDAKSFGVCAPLESANGNSSSQPTSGNNITFTPQSGSSATYYCVVSRQ